MTDAKPTSNAKMMSEAAKNASVHAAEFADHIRRIHPERMDGRTITEFRRLTLEFADAVSCFAAFVGVYVESVDDLTNAAMEAVRRCDDGR
jgi:hypothetical protein